MIKEAVIMAMIICFVFVALLAALTVSYNFLSDYQCHEKWVGRNPYYSWATDCIIDTDQGRIPAANFRPVK